MNTRKIRQDFPLFSEQKGIFGMKKKQVIYFDNACMTLRPRQVVTAMNQYYYDYPACALRSQHKMARRATDAYQDAREVIAKFIGAKPDEIIFTRNTTESINLVAQSFPFKKGDVVLGSDKEHNSNLVPWLMLKDKGVKHEIIPSKDGELDVESFANMLGPNTKMIAIQHTSNLDGTSIPLSKVIKIAHANKTIVLVDGAQSVPTMPIDVKKMDIDFLAFSGHKMLGPSGTGVLYGKKELLEQLKPFITGGETVKDTWYDKVEFEDVPGRFEAGLQDYAGFIGLAEACRYLKKNGLSKLANYETLLNKKMTDALGKIDDIEILGPKDAIKRGGIFSFNIKNMDHHQIALLLDASKNIAIRSGAHCAHSWFNANKIMGSARASFYLYNTQDEVDEFIDGINEILKIKR